MKILRSILAGVAALALSVTVAGTASAGSGDPDLQNWYWSNSCKAGGSYPVTFKLTNYDVVVNGTLKQRYHYALGTNTNRVPDSIEWWRNGTFVTTTSNLRDGYKDFSSYTAKYIVYAYWHNSSGGLYYCSITM